MSTLYSGEREARAAREALAGALELLQQEGLPDEASTIAQHIAESIGALYEASQSSSEPDGRSCVGNALSSLSQTLALLQDMRADHTDVENAVSIIAQAMNILYPLTNRPSYVPPAAEKVGPVESAGETHGADTKVPAADSLAPAGASAGLDSQGPPGSDADLGVQAPAARPAAAEPAPPSDASAASTQDAPIESAAALGQSAAPPMAAPDSSPVRSSATATPPQSRSTESAGAAESETSERRANTEHAHREEIAPELIEQAIALEVNVGATTESNFYVGFSGEVSRGGVFFATYESFPKGSYLRLHVTLPGRFEFHALGQVHFVREASQGFFFGQQPGMGIRFINLDTEARALVLRFVAKRAPMFFESDSDPEPG